MSYPSVPERQREAAWLYRIEWHPRVEHVPMILEDKLVYLRLSEHPELLARLAEFVHFYELVDRAALIAQARPTNGLRIDLDDVKVVNVFRTGVATSTTWWDGFRSMIAPRRTMHGLGSLPDRDAPAWGSELHSDGHFIAGIWRYPEMHVDDREVEVMADFYVDFLADFGLLVESTLQHLADQQKYYLTWTLINASKLYYANRSMFGQLAVRRRPLAIANVQSIVWTATPGTPDWTSALKQMGASLLGAYSDAPRQ